MSRNEELLAALLSGGAVDFEPQSRNEELLLSLLNGEKPACTPKSRMEALLLACCEKGLGGSGGSTGTGHDCDWVRPDDWLPYPEFSTEQDEVWVLVHVYPTYGAARLPTTPTANRIDWGDGIVQTENLNFDNGSIPNHFYDYAAISSETETAEGLRQVWARASYDRGSLARVVLGWGSANSSGANGYTTMVEMVINSASERVIVWTYAATQKGNRNFYHIKNVGSAPLLLTQMQNADTIRCIEGAYRLDWNNTHRFKTEAWAVDKLNWLPAENESRTITTAASKFNGCLAKNIEADLYGITDASSFIAGCPNIYELVLRNTESVTNFNGFANGSKVVRVKGLNLQSATNLENAFRDCAKLRYIEGLDTLGEQVTTLSFAFYQTNIPWLGDFICPNCTNVNSTFYNSQIVHIGTVDFSAGTNMSNTFARMDSLQDISFVEGSIKAAMNIGVSGQLSDASIQSIIDGLCDATGGTALTITLNSTVAAKLTQVQLDTIASKNWNIA